MAELKAQKTADSLAPFPTAKEVMEQIATNEAEKASAAVRELSAAEAEKKALIEKLSKPSGVSDKERLARAAAIIKRAANNGLTEVEVVRFPNELCTDRGRAINQREPYKVGFQIVDFPRRATRRYRDNVEAELNRLAAPLVCTQLERDYWSLSDPWRFQAVTPSVISS
jgi:hypothetical protein